MKFYGHNYVVLSSEIFYLRFYDFSTYTILTVILQFLYGKISSTILQFRFYYPSLKATSVSCQNHDFDNPAYDIVFDIAGKEKE